ncbi:50S ribosomal protein L19 [Candidatus Omnitrophota bacterium]
MDKMKLVEGQLLKKDLPKFSVGDQLKVYIKILEADKVRIHPFEGTVIRKRGQGMGSTFTLRKMSFGEGVERTFTLNSPSIDKIELLRRGKVRRSKIYYLRKRVGKATKVKEKK